MTDYVAGALGGIGGLIVGHPLDTVKVQLQVRGMSKGGTWQAFKDIRKYGLSRGFYRGMSFPATAQIVSCSVFFGVYRNTLDLIEYSIDQGGGGGGGGTVGKSGDLPRLSPSLGRVFIAGCSSGLFQVLVSCPTDLIKVVLQSQLSVVQPIAAAAAAPTHRKHVTAGQCDHVTLDRDRRIASSGLRPLSSGGATARYFRGPWEATVWIYRRHGPLGLYRGCGAFVLRDTFTFGLYMVVYEWLHRKLILSSYSDSGGVIASLLAGGSAGVVAWATCMPFDVIKTNIQSDVEHRKYRGVVDCAAQVYRRAGLRGFFAGLPVACVRAFPVNAATFLVYSKTLAYMNRLTVTADAEPAF